MARYLGGITDVQARWVSPTAIDVSFTSSNSGMTHQLYYGRRLVAETSNPAVRVLTAQVDPGPWQNHLQVLAVSGTDAGVDHGSDLPRRPYNVAKLVIDASNFPADAAHLDVFRGATAGAAVSETVWFRIPYEGARSYTVYTPPLPGSGTWNLSIVGRDSRPNGGNVGTPIALTVTVDAHPPDFVDPFTVSVSSGTGTITATLPAD